MRHTASSTPDVTNLSRGAISNKAADGRAEPTNSESRLWRDSRTPDIGYSKMSALFRQKVDPLSAMRAENHGAEAAAAPTVRSIPAQGNALGNARKVCQEFWSLDFDSVPKPAPALNHCFLGAELDLLGNEPPTQYDCRKQRCLRGKWLYNCDLLLACKTVPA